MFEQFVKEREYLKGVTAKTLAFYRQSWSAFQRHHSGEITKASLKEFVTNMRKAGIKPVSCNTYISCINAYLRWLHEEHGHELLKIQKLKVEKRKGPSLTDGELKRIISWRPTAVSDRRIHTLLLTLLDTGIRIEEALLLTRSKIDFDNLLLVVNGKGRKDRTIPFSIELRKVLYKFLQSHTHEIVFSTRHGNRLSYHNCRRDFRKLMDKLGINPACAFHGLRRTFALGFVRSGGNLFALQRYLGHTTLAMTRLYTELEVSDLKAARSGFSLLR